MMGSSPIFMGDSDDYAQHEILTKIAEALESGVLTTTRRSNFEWSKLPEAHDQQESGKCIGKQVSLVKF